MTLDEQVKAIKAEASEMGLKIIYHDGIVTVRGSFETGDRDAYVKMEGDAYTILRYFRQVRAGSVWGTDSGSIGGHVGLTNGYVTMNKSGVDKRLGKRFALWTTDFRSTS